MVTTHPVTDLDRQFPRIMDVGLLVSVRSREEADLAIEFPVDWIDVKEPDRGALGRPEKDLALAIQLRLNQSSRPRPLSVALGELQGSDWSELSHFVQGFTPQTFFKVALADCADASRVEAESWQLRLKRLAHTLPTRDRLIPVFYADFQASQCPSWDQILAICHGFGGRRVLIDTWQKGEKGLVDFLPMASLQTMIGQAKGMGIDVAIAGSVRCEQIPYLLQTGADVIGVRGAACKNQKRTSVMSEEALSSLCKQFSSRSSHLQDLAIRNGT
jgi:(5-formylfuran-3-yl)methyl phosphate synthase